MNAVELLGELQWRAPAWLLLALQPILVLLLRRWAQRRSAERFAAPALLPWVQLVRHRPLGGWRSVAHVGAWLLVALAAAGPRLPEREPGQALRVGVEWMLAVDVSESMAATDVAPSRLKRARIELLQWLTHARGDRVGLVVYAGTAHLLAPPTHDLDALGRYLALLQTDLLPTRGSRPDRALDLAAEALAAYPDHGRAVLLVTDHAGDSAVSAAAAARLRDQGIAVYVLGMGSPAGSIEIAAGDGQDLRSVAVPLTQSELQRIAEAGAGAYATVADDDSDLQRLYGRGIATLAQPRPGASPLGQTQWRELFPWLLLPALLLFAASLLTPRRARRTAMAGVVVLALNAAYPSSGHTADLGRQAHDAYREGRFQTARDLFARQAGFEARLGEGASAYRLKDFARAQREFTGAVLTAASDAQRAAALLNLGNAYFQLGDYRNAATAFEDALRYEPGFEAAQRNLALARLVADAVERRLPGNRPGAGQRSREFRPGEGPGPLTLGEDAPPVEQRATTDPAEDDALAELVARGLRHARVAARGGTEDAVDSVGGEPSAAALAHFSQLEQDPVRVWRRLFELEQGFPAPLLEPRTEPGVEPW